MIGLLHAPLKGCVLPHCCVLTNLAKLAALQHDDLDL